MKKNLAIYSFVCIAMALSVPTVSGQTFQGGYQFGAGLGASGFVPGGLGGGFFDPFFGPVGGLRTFSREQPPYFAQFPPVYYSHIVRRPYGVSPFAAPPGIMPVEMAMPAAAVPPQQIANPYFCGENHLHQEFPVEQPEELPIEEFPDTLSEELLDDQPSPSDSTTSVQWQKNPYFSPIELSVKE